MIPIKSRRVIEAVFDLHGTSLPMEADDRLPIHSFAVVAEYGEKPYIIGHTRMINWARDIRDNSLVPLLYSDEASTWA